MITIKLEQNESVQLHPNLVRPQVLTTPKGQIVSALVEPGRVITVVYNNRTKYIYPKDLLNGLEFDMCNRYQSSIYFSDGVINAGGATMAELYDYLRYHPDGLQTVDYNVPDVVYGNDTFSPQ
jgi:hypothetical protein